jgi:alanyl-tRNA synthetase
MTSAEIRQSFLDFFREKQHTIVPSSSLLPDAPNLLFTNAGMNQFVPIFLGQQKPAFDPPRAADTQKCIRAGGKHNDLEDVGLDTYHHTFFEMLGNWSFGDYFKKEAIEWAWELVVRRWKFPPERLYATVYRPGPREPSQFDQEAHEHWNRLFGAAGLDPAIHIVNGNKADNFWMMGDTGPCGPCSELHVDLTPAGDTRGSLVNANDPRCIEIWNLVFIQFNANADGTFTSLPARHVDTGMGFERVTAIIQGTNELTDFSGTISNYETDIFRPIFDEIERLSGKRYGGTLPGSHASSMTRPAGFQPAEPSDGQDVRQPSQAGSPTSEQDRVDIAFRVIADHIRTLSFAIADGIQPGNEGRGYVLRRILRRAVRYGRSLGFHEPFFHKLVGVLAQTMGAVFPELHKRQPHIQETLKREEESFNRTLDRGMDVFDRAAVHAITLQAIATPGLAGVNIRGGRYFRRRPETTSPEIDPEQDNSKLFDQIFKARPGISSKAAFDLYDTYGFPLDLTELMARERGLTVDTEGFQKLMEEQRNRARKAQKKSVIEVADTVEQPPTNFLGYEHDHTGADVEAILGVGDRKGIVLNNSVLYAEMGGQVGDQGEMIGESGSWKIEDTRKSGDTSIHLIAGESTPAIGEHVTVRLDRTRRATIERHHTVTHLLHWALHEVVSLDATQKGSYVGPEKLTFDFLSAALTKQQVREVEKLVNEKITENEPVSWTEIPYPEVKQRADIMQFFGDRYGDLVRVVQIGGQPSELNGYSMELCGGTHVRTTGDIGSFRILSEGAIAAGIRRIEAIAGNAVGEWARTEAKRQEERFQALARKKSGLAALPAFETTTAAAMAASIDTRAAHLEKLGVEVRDWEKANAKATEAGMQSRAAAIANEMAWSDGAAYRIARVPDADGKLLQAITDVLKTRFDGPIFLAGEKEGRVALIASVPKALTSRYEAGKLIQETAPLIGGKGGGRPELAQGGGTDVTKIDAALARAKELLT